MSRLIIVSLLTLIARSGLLARTTPIAFEPAEMVDMQQTIFSSGGTLELQDSYGAVEILGWDQPQIEVTVTKASQRRYPPEDMERILSELDKIVVSTDRLASNHVVIRTEFPSRGAFSPSARAKSKLSLQYVIRVPRQTRIVVRHEVGEVRVHDVAASVDVAARIGGIQLDLPATGRFRIDARARSGDVRSEWRAAMESPCECQPAHRVILRVGIGDIQIRKGHADSSNESSEG